MQFLTFATRRLAAAIQRGNAMIAQEGQLHVHERSAAGRIRNLSAPNKMRSCAPFPKKPLSQPSTRRAKWQFLASFDSSRAEYPVEELVIVGSLGSAGRRFLLTFNRSLSFDEIASNLILPIF
jgi:hypothetical protein